MKKFKFPFYIISIIIIILGIIFIPKLISPKVDIDTLQAMLKDINDTANEALSSPTQNQAKYLKLLEEETDPFTKGKYASALVGLYSFNGDFDGVMKYGQLAIDNYRKIPGGDFLAVSENKYIAWSMTRIGRYSDAFVFCNELLEMINNDKYQVLSENDVLDAEILVYSIYLTTFSEFKVYDKAKLYYDKLLAIPLDDKLKLSKGDEMYYSLMQYAYTTKDYSLTKKYAEKLYELQLLIDKDRGTNMADSLLINLGLANIFLGNLDEGLEQVKKAENLFVSLDSEYSLETVYHGYANYYIAKNQPKNAMNYISKRLKILKKHNDIMKYNATLESTIAYITTHNLNYDLKPLYKEFYDTTIYLNENDKASDLLSTTITINNELNTSKLNALEKSNSLAKNFTIILILATIALLFLSNRLLKLYNIKKESEKKLSEMVNYDYLTKTYSRSYGYKLLNNLIQNKTNFSIAMIDIDNFKKINDTFGHSVGDEVLVGLGQAIIRNLEQGDFVLRTGGEEFIIAFINKDKQTSINLLKKYNILFSKLNLKHNLSLSFSAGVSTRTDEELDTLIIKADKLLYKSKNLGKNLIL
ncbi:MAG: GGDEF domain-containing protein [Clostridium sp.]|uniref:GGDEF domain-containing protein n=1 Tax=Clostridium sp. TaxID=1506 RepID=UPI003F2FCDA5